MKCSECAEGRRFTGDSWFCVAYGMIIREKDKCTRKGARKREEREEDDLVDDLRVHSGGADRTDHGGADQRDGGQNKRTEETEA